MPTRRELAGLIGATGVAAVAPLTAGAAKSRRAESEALKKFAEATHPRAREAMVSADWRDSWAELARNADRLSDGAYVVALRRALAWFEDGHTTVLPFEFTGGVPAAFAAGPFGMRLPLRVRIFDDGAWVIRAKDEAAPLLGAKITRVAGVPIEQAVAALVASWSGENTAWGHNWAWLLFSSAGLLHGLGLMSGRGDADVAIDAVTARGESVSTLVRPRTDGAEALRALTRTTTPPENFAATAGRANFVWALSERAAVYVSIDEMGDVEGYTSDQLTADALAAIAPVSITRVILDLRRNGGGDNYAGETLRRELARSRFNRPGGLCILTSPQTFSAAQNFVNRLERETFAVFVGEPTGSAPNMHGDAAIFTGSSTGITAMVSTLRWYDGGPHDRRRWIFPDTFAPQRFADWFAGTDTALEAALSLADPGEDSFRTHTRYFERASQSTTWRPFWRQV